MILLKLNLILALILPIFFLTIQKVQAATANGTARQVVLQAIAIANVSDLVFPVASPGATAATVAPGTAENASNGSFNVTGAANQAYTITLPTTINMTNGANTIAVNTFTSFPSGSGTLSATGTQLLLVGATRAALTATQATGTYTGTYTVTVVY